MTGYDLAAHFLHFSPDGQNKYVDFNSGLGKRCSLQLWSPVGQNKGSNLENEEIKKA